jgi:hypothetical protein
MQSKNAPKPSADEGVDNPYDDVDKNAEPATVDKPDLPCASDAANN